MSKVASLAADPDALIDESAAARFLDVSIRFMQKHRVSGDGPPYIKISARCVRYRRGDLKAWAEQRIRTSTTG